MKFTDKYLLSLKPQEKMYQQRESDGFGIRVLPSGFKNFVFVYTLLGKRRQMNLGDYPDISLAKARERAAEARRILKDGTDPQEVGLGWHKNPVREREEAVRREEEDKLHPTVSKLVEEYIEKHAKKFKKSWGADKRLLDVEIVPVWGSRKAQDIRKRDVTLLLENIVDRGTPAMSNQVLKITRKMFNFAVERDILQMNPFTGVKALAPNVSRDRTLTETEIKTLWANLDDAAMSEEIKRALKLVLVTGQRPGEVSGMHTSEIEGEWWTIPSDRAKNGQEHRVYLTRTALDIIGPLTVIDDLSGEEKPKGYIFSCPHKIKVKPIDSHALPVAVRRNLAWPITDKNGKPLFDGNGKPATENKLGVDKWTPHDLRRTAATFMAGIGFMDEVIDAVLNHVKQGIIRTYNRHKYDKEKQLALEAWELRLKSIVTGKSQAKVIPITLARHE